MRAFAVTVLLAAAAASLGGCCALARQMCTIDVGKTPIRATRDTPSGAVDVLVEAFRRRAPGDVYESMHPDFRAAVAPPDGFSMNDFAAAYDQYEADFREDAERLAAGARNVSRRADGLAVVELTSGGARVALVFKDVPVARVLVDDPQLPGGTRAAIPGLDEMVQVDQDTLVVTTPIPLGGEGDFLDPATIRRIELAHDWLLYHVAAGGEDLNFVRRLRDLKGGRP